MLPQEAAVVGFIGTGDDMDISLWRPFGARKVEHFGLDDPSDLIRKRHVEYVVLGGLNLKFENRTLESWLAETGGELSVRVSIDAAGWKFTVSDQGPGIPAGFEEKVFEVGFTTRTGPFHAGMGLPVARHLAGQAGGTLQLANGPGGGCVATIRVPMKARV